jgi:hypothetical protein
MTAKGSKTQSKISLKGIFQEEIMKPRFLTHTRNMD